MHHHLKLSVFLACALSLCAAQPLDPAVAKALATIRPSELKGDLSFLASDLLQGRYTPSPGLEIAAEFIASKFRAFGLKPGGTADYFQLAEMIDRKLPRVTNPISCKDGSNTITIDPDKIQITKAGAALSLTGSPVLKIADVNPDKLKNINLDGKIILTVLPDFSNMPAADRESVYERMQAFNQIVSHSKAVAEILVTKSMRHGSGKQFLFAEDAQLPTPPVLQIQSTELAEAVTNSSTMTLSVSFEAPVDARVTVKNVIGILQGSDSKLKSTCVLVTAHYDHIGTTETGAGLSAKKPEGEDHIYNGANDDGSGTVSVIEIARALSPLHPKRSIVFMTFFGEERGLLGSTYYGRHSVFPISKTIADMNLEQVGRTDSSEGPEIANASITGYDYSDVTKYLEAAGKLTGITIYKDENASDQFFTRSDNAALAEQGVPAHTLTTAFEYPDYHGLGDEWQKIDYENMAKVDRTVALAVLNIANTATPPAWNTRNPKTKPFIDAQKKKPVTGTTLNLPSQSFLVPPNFSTAFR